MKLSNLRSIVEAGPPMMSPRPPWASYPWQPTFPTIPPWTPNPPRPPGPPKPRPAVPPVEPGEPGTEPRPDRPPRPPRKPDRFTPSDLAPDTPSGADRVRGWVHGVRRLS